MTAGSGLPPVRVEHALRLLPVIEALAPLRALLVAEARADRLAQWHSSAPYLTVGKRGVQPTELRPAIPQVVRRAADHLSVLYECYVQALECEQRRDGAGAVAALLKAGEREEALGRLTQAHAWYEVALTVSEGLQERQPEIATLRALGQLAHRQGRHATAARAFQRCYVLAEAEFDQSGAIAACQGLGDAALAQGQRQGARAWYARALRLAEAAGDAAAIGHIDHQMALWALRQADPTSAARHLAHARERFEQLGDARKLAQALNTEGLLEAYLGRHSQARGAYLEALAWLHKQDSDPDLEVSVRLNLAELYLQIARPFDAEQEIRRAEEVAIAHNLTPRLIQIYTLMGKLRGEQRDETGFVFFEQAIALCRTLDGAPALEGQVYYEYGLSRSLLGHQEEARAYLETARELFASLGGGVDLERVVSELQRISA